MCATVASRVEGTVVNDCLRGAGTGPINIGHPSGVLDVDAVVRRKTGWVAERATVFRTCRRLMAGQVYVPADVLEPSSH
jgi:2-methylaconitate cis-trans-isomerase PrpF